MDSRAYIGQFSADGTRFFGMMWGYGVFLVSPPTIATRLISHYTAAFQGTHRVRVYDVANSWKLVKDVEARGLRWTITDTALSPDGRFLLYSTIDDIVRMVSMAA